MQKLSALGCLLPFLLMARPEYTKAPDFRRVDAAGHTVQLSKYKGKVVLLDFWATWCTGCKTEIPWFIDFAVKYRTQGLAAIGVAMDDEGWSVVKPFLAEKMKLTYPVVLGDKTLAMQFGGINSMPVTLLLDRQGRIAYAHTGVVDRAEFDSKIRELLADAR